MSRSEHIAVVGAGSIGRGVAQTFAAKGHEVILTDNDRGVLGGALRDIREDLDFLCRKGVQSSENATYTLRNIKIASGLRETVTEARFVIEAVTEKLEVKQELFKEMEMFCSQNAILATSTSTIRITDIASAVKRRERVLGTHFWNPPYLVPLVEVVRSRYTAPDVIDYTVALLKTAGKHPVRVQKDAPGFIGNRLQHALWREALSIVGQGIADAASVDEVVKNGFGIRLPVMAPLENADMMGLDLTLEIQKSILQHLDRSREPASILKEKVARGELGFSTGKGFYSWDQDSIEERKQRLLEHLVKWSKERDEGQDAP